MASPRPTPSTYPKMPRGMGAGITLDEFADMLEGYLGWYRDVRLKSDLDYRSPMQYRRDLGLIA